jgi:hypothetical protein
MMPEAGMEAEVANNGGDGAREIGGVARPVALSLLRYSPALVVFIIAVTDVGRWADPDLWGHIRFGQLTLSLGHAPVRNPYSYSAPGYLWRDPEWLAEALLALAYDTLGVVGLKLMKFAATAVTVLLMALAAAETRASVRIQLVVLMVAGVALIPMMQFRPPRYGSRPRSSRCGPTLTAAWLPGSPRWRSMREFAGSRISPAGAAGRRRSALAASRWPARPRRWSIHTVSATGSRSNKRYATR